MMIFITALYHFLTSGSLFSQAAALIDVFSSVCSLCDLCGDLCTHMLQRRPRVPHAPPPRLTYDNHGVNSGGGG